MSDDESRPEGEAEGAPRRPAPPFPSNQGKNVLFWAADSDDGPAREFEDILMRRVPAAVAHHFRGAAGARGLTHAQYLAALIRLHETMRQQADGGDAEATAVLDRLGLRTISI